MTSNGILLEGTGLVRRYGGRSVVDVDRVSLRQGELFAVFGANGAGKSTLMRLLAMLERPDEGSVRYRGQGGRSGERALRAASSVVFQRGYFWRGSVEYNIGLGLSMRRRLGREEIGRRVGEICEELGISHLREARVSELSGGEAQRVGLARALVLDPEILFLDEPTAGLDTDARLSLRRDFERVGRERATSALLITHDRNEAFYLADRVGVMRAGRLVQTGTPREVYENPFDEYTARATGAEFTVRGVVAECRGRMLRVDVGGLNLETLGEAEPGTTVRVAYRPEDLVLSATASGGGETHPNLSTRNAFKATVAERRDLGSFVRLRLAGPMELVALVTASSADELKLGPGKPVTVRIKATALHAFAQGTPRDSSGS